MEVRISHTVISEYQTRNFIAANIIEVMLVFMKSLKPYQKLSMFY